MNVDGFQRRKIKKFSIFEAFNLHTVDLVAISWPICNPQKGKSLYLTPWGLIFDANIDFLNMQCSYLLPRHLVQI